MLLNIFVSTIQQAIINDNYWHTPNFMFNLINYEQIINNEW